MIILTALYGSRFFIGHFPQQHAPGATCTFDQSFLPENIINHVRSLTSSDGHDCTVYALNKSQNIEVATIFRKLQSEAKSGYTFSHQLQKTYLVELIHFITKLKHTLQPSAQA